MRTFLLQRLGWFLATGLLAAACATSVQGQRTLFTDNFNSPDSAPAAGGINAGVRVPDRQGGTLAPLEYKQKPSSGAQAALSGGTAAIGKKVNAFVSLDHDFLTDFKDSTLTPAPLDLSAGFRDFKIAPVLLFTCTFTTPTGDTPPAVSFVFFSLANAPGTLAQKANFSLQLSGAGTGQVLFGETTATLEYAPARAGANNLSLHFTSTLLGETDTVEVTINGASTGSYIIGKGGAGDTVPSVFLTFGTMYNAASNFDDLSVTAPTLPPK